MTTPDSLRAYFGETLCWQTIARQLPLNHPLASDALAIAKAGHVTAVALLYPTGTLPNSSTRKQLYATLQQYFSPDLLLLFVTERAILWRWKSDEMRTSFPFPEHLRHRLQLPVDQDVSRHEICSRLDRLFQNPDTTMALQHPLLDTLDMLTTALNQLRNDAAELAMQAFRKHGDLTLDDIQRLRAVFDHIEQKISMLRSECIEMFTAFPALRSIGRKPASQQELSSIPSTAPRHPKRTDRVMATPRSDFTCPILHALVEAGGKAHVRDVLKRVGELMSDRLKPDDHELLPSVRDVRWKNRAQWQRFEMTRRGLLRSDSPHGIWEITEHGMHYYQTTCREQK